MEQAPFSAFAMARRDASASAERRALDPAMTPVYAGLGLGWAALLIGLPLVGLSVDAMLVAVFLAVCGLCVWGAACLRMRGLGRIATGIESWALLNAACLTGILATYAAARLSAPLADGWMASADRLIAPGLDWRETMIALARRPVLIHWANRAYASLQWQGSLLILVCCIAGHTERCAGFVLRWMIALLLVCLVFALLPCNGPYAYYHIAHAEVPGVGANIGWRQPELLAWLRTPGPLRLDPSALDGIVEFPSFHTAAAILLAWGFWPVRWARWPMLALNLAMIAAAMPVGGHYYVDVLGGVAVAWAAIGLPGWVARIRTVR